MKFYSLHQQAPSVSFKEAVIQGIAPDKGLYFPERISPLPGSFFKGIQHIPSHEIAFQAIRQFVTEDIPDAELKRMLRETLDFDFPLIKIEEHIAALELFHGPTMAFKDVGARFMAQCLGYFSKGEAKRITVVVATSGDTGSAVANGFLGVEGVHVVILYPSGKVSDIQELQLTTLGQNITALEVDGTFDDCQHMVKKAFLDKELTARMKLTSANSINVARWLPQMFYFLFAYKKSKSEGRKLVFSVPSGNFGNVCAGMVAQRLGMPVHRFIAATNVNDTVPDFFRTGKYSPKPSVATISNAMDVGDPSNFVRIRELYKGDFDLLSKNLSSFAFTDTETKKAMNHIFRSSGYIADPHGAVAYLGLKKHLGNAQDTFGIFLETAHPIKFGDVVEATIGKSLEVPKQIQSVLGKSKKSLPIDRYDALKQFLLKSS